MKPDKFSEWGIASVLPGARYIVERMLEEIKHLEHILQAHQENRELSLRRVAQELKEEFSFEPKRRGRPPGVKNGQGRPPGVKSLRGQWRTKSGRLMNKQERSDEMKRRRSMWANPKANAQKKANHPRNANHPDHTAYIAKMKKAALKRWRGAGKVNGAATEVSA